VHLIILQFNQLPFLDTLVSYNPTAKSFSATLYVKPIHSKCITPWDGHGSVASKRAILVGETRRAIACPTNPTHCKESFNKVFTLFVNNGYPKRFVRAIISSLPQYLLFSAGWFQANTPSGLLFESRGRNLNISGERGAEIIALTMRLIWKYQPVQESSCRGLQEASFYKRPPVQEAST
jgi:hypothetical protein